MPTRSTPRQRSTSRAERPRSSSGSRTWLTAALTAWDDTHRTARELERAWMEVELDEAAWPREVRAAMDAMRLADRTRPDWVELSVDGDSVGEPPRDVTWSERQLERTRQAARRLRAQLNEALERLREVRRTRPMDGAFEAAAAAAEAAVTSILRPLSRAVATSTEPLQRGLGHGVGLALAAVGIAALFMMRR
jgi:hypothetical protein